MKKLFLALLVASGTAFAQPYPSKPVRVAVAFPPGGPVDIIARLFGPKLSELLGGQSVVVENVVGAGGNVATTRVAKSAPDGYTLLAHSSAYAVNPTLIPNAGYDGEKDFVALAVVASQPNFIVVHADFPAKTLAELIARAKTDKLAFASAGNGTTPHLTGENLFKLRAKLDITHIPFKGGGPAVVAVIAGQCQFIFATSLSVQPHMKSGKVRALAVTTPKRSPSFPDLPTVSEAGVPGFEALTWHGFVAPARTPKPVIARLNSEFNKVFQQPDIRSRLTTLGSEIIGGKPQDLTDYIRKEIPVWAKVIKETGARAD